MTFYPPFEPQGGQSPRQQDAGLWAALAPPPAPAFMALASAALSSGQARRSLACQTAENRPDKAVYPVYFISLTPSVPKRRSLTVPAGAIPTPELNGRLTRQVNSWQESQW